MNDESSSLVPRPQFPVQTSPQVVQMEDKIIGEPSLWTTRRGESLLSFYIKIDMKALMARAGVTNLSEVRKALRWPPLSGHEEELARDPGIIATRIKDHLNLYLESALGPICGGRLHGENGTLGDSSITIGINVPGEYAHAMAALFSPTQTVSRREGFVEPKENLPLQGVGNMSPPKTLDELQSILNMNAIAAVDLRNELIVQTPAEWGDFGVFAGQVAKKTIETGERTVYRRSRDSDTPPKLPGR